MIKQSKKQIQVCLVKQFNITTHFKKTYVVSAQWWEEK